MMNIEIQINMNNDQENLFKKDRNISYSVRWKMYQQQWFLHDLYMEEKSASNGGGFCVR